MCGLLACIGIQDDLPSDELFLNSLNLQAHRGPDDSQIFRFDGGMFGFRRLSIIDQSSKSNQPIKYEDIILVFNGEIYNYIELADILKEQGFCLKTSGDSEVLAACIFAWGAKKAFSMARGMWSAVIYNSKTKEVFISRDRLGIKPLWVAQSNRMFIISSEIKSILAIDSTLNLPNYSYIANYMLHGILDEDENTFFKNIKSFPKGTFAEISKLEPLQDWGFSSYWQRPSSHSSRVSSQELGSVLKETISLHCRRDVELGVALSGGIDSTILAGSTKSDHSIKFYSVVPPDSADESNLIDETVSKWSLNHEYIECRKYETLQTIDYLISMLDQPFKAAQTLYQYAIRKAASDDGVRVFLTGDGADEVFGGYKFFIPSVLAEFFLNFKIFKAVKLSSQLQNFSGYKQRKLIVDTLKHIILKFIPSAFKNRDYVNSQHLSLLIQSHSKKYFKPYFVNLKKHMLFRLFVSGIPYWLRVEDGISMACSIETRVPYLDHELIDHSFKYSSEKIFFNGVNKSQLRRVASCLLPSHIKDLRTKQQRPGNSARIIFDVLFDEAVDSFSECNIFISPDAVSSFKRDKDLRRNSGFWFRAFLAVRWYKIYCESSICQA